MSKDERDRGYAIPKALADQYDRARLALIRSGADLGRIVLKPKRKEEEA